MANSLTHKGEEIALKRPTTPSDKGSIAYAATKVRLFTGLSAPDKDGSGFVEVAGGTGYTEYAITEADWTYTALTSKITLKQGLLLPKWDATGSIENVRGAYLVNAGGDVLAWWELTSAITLASGDSITLDDLTIKFV